VPQFARRPFCRIETGVSENEAERAADVSGQEHGADTGGEHKIVVMPSLPRLLATLVLTVTVETQRLSTALG
jgi:hypothetical protein